MDAIERITLSREADTEIQAVLNKWRNVLGPEKDPVREDWCEHDEIADECACPVPETVMLTEYVVVMNWTDLEGQQMDDDVVTAKAAHGMKRSHTVGLLTGAMDHYRGH